MRKYKDKIDLRVVTYAIKDAMKPKRGPSLVSGNYSHGFMLTADGFSLVKSLATTSESIKSSSYRNRSIAEKLILEKNRLASSTAYIKYISGESENITFGDFQDFARVNEYFPAHAQRRYALISNVVRDDEKLESCWQFLQENLLLRRRRMSNRDILVSSHVARDFLQNSAYFNTLPKVVWEYVSNSLDNAKEDIPITVNVDLFPSAPKKLVIADNGVGMSKDDLIRFFQMHGENVQRKKGKRVRGRFGTGKSAAFGIANALEIDTIKNGFRNNVKLTRKMIESAIDGSSFPVEILVDNEKISDDNSQDGTKVFISDFIDGKINFERTILFIERNLSRYKQKRQ